MILEAGLALAVFGMALAGMAPGIALEDSGEFVTAAVTQTLTHPPGYPLYLLVGKLASLLPVGSPAFRLSLLSAGCIAATAALLARIARTRLGAPPLAAIAAGLIVVCAPAAMFQAHLADKYPLHLLLTAALVSMFLRTGPSARWPGLGLAGGLALSHHMMTVYLAPAALLLAVRDRLWMTPRTAALVVVCGVIGFSVKPVALPALSLHAPSLMYAPLDRADILAKYLSARDYSERFTAFPLEEKLKRVVTHGAAELWRQAGWPALAAGIAGAAAVRQILPGAMPAALGGITIAIGLVASFQIAGIGYYLLPAVMFVALLAAVALAAWHRSGFRLLSTAVSLLIALHAAHRGGSAADLSRYFGGHDWGRNLLAGIGEYGVLVSRHDDDFYPVMYHQRVLEERPDVALIHRPFITKLWHHAQVQALRPGFAVLDRTMLESALAAGDGATLRPPEIINLFLRSHYIVHDLTLSYLAVEECAGGFSLTPHGPSFRVTRPPTRERPRGPGIEAALPTAGEFAAVMRRYRWRHISGPWPAGSRFAEIAGAPAAAWTQLSLRWWDRNAYPEARACMARALKFPYTRVVRADLDRVAGVMGF